MLLQDPCIAALSGKVLLMSDLCFLINLWFLFQIAKDVEFHIEGSIRHMNISSVTKVTKMLSKKLGIPERHINVRGIGSGSLILVLQMPEYGVDRLREAILRRDAWLWKERILDIHIEGEACVKIQDQHSQSMLLGYFILIFDYYSLGFKTHKGDISMVDILPVCKLHPL